MLGTLVQNSGNKNIYKRLKGEVTMAILQISIDTFFSSMDSWDTSIAESSKWYASYVASEEPTNPTSDC